VSHKSLRIELLNRFLGLIAHITRRPLLYTHNGSFWEIVAYLEGYFHGVGNPTGKYGSGKENGLMMFGPWLTCQSGLSDQGHWASILLEYCEVDEQRAIQEPWPIYK
jgi:hypothetical protein